MYYELDNFYQNHREYVKSRSNTQLYGEWQTLDLAKTCIPTKQVKNLWPEQQYSWATKGEFVTLSNN